MSLAHITPQQANELEHDIRAGDLSWRKLQDKWGYPHASIRDWAKRRGILRGTPTHARAVAGALAGDDEADVIDTAERIATRALRRIDAELGAMLAPENTAALDPRSLKTLLESVALALDIHGRATSWGLPSDLTEMSDAQLDAIAAGKRIR